MDKDTIKDVINDFENEDYVDAKEKLTNAVRQDRDDYLKQKLSLKSDEEE